MENIYLQNLGIGRGMKVGKEAIFAARVDLPEPELPKIKIFFELVNLEKSFDANLFESSLKKETLPSSKSLPMYE